MVSLYTYKTATAMVEGNEHDASVMRERLLGMVMHSAFYCSAFSVADTVDMAINEAALAYESNHHCQLDTEFASALITLSRWLIRESSNF